MTRVLAESATIKDAAQACSAPSARISTGNSACSGKWRTDRVIRFVDLWHAPDVEAAEFIKDSRDRTFTRGEGLVGRVWDTGKPIWIPDVCADPSFRRGGHGRGSRAAWRLCLSRQQGRAVIWRHRLFHAHES